MDKSSIRHAYVIDFSQTDPEDTVTRKFELGGNAPTHLCVTSPYFAASGCQSGFGREPSPAALERMRVRKLEAEARKEAREEKAQARRDETARQKAADKALREERSKIEKEKDLARKEAARERERERHRALLERNCNSEEAVARIRAKYREQKRRQHERDLGLGIKRWKKKGTSKPNIPEGYISAPEAARKLGLSATTVGKYIDAGRIQCYRCNWFKYVILSEVIRERDIRAEAFALYKKEFGARRKEACKTPCQDWDDKYILSSPAAPDADGDISAAGR